MPNLRQACLLDGSDVDTRIEFKWDKDGEIRSGIIQRIVHEHTGDGLRTHVIVAVSEGQWWEGSFTADDDVIICGP